MFRSRWDSVSPFSWLNSLAGEEEFMRGFDESYPSTHFVFIPASQRQRRSEDELMDEEGEETEEKDEQDEEKMEETASEEQRAAMLMNESFFADLPVGAKLMDTKMPPNLSPPDSKTKDGYAFFTYSYSTCLTADDQGRRVNSTRRRYEDSAGCLKALHNRRIGDCTMESTWKRASEQDEGKHDKKVSSGSVEAFEKAWEHTPFGVAEQQAKAHGSKQQNVLPDEPPPQELP